MFRKNIVVWAKISTLIVVRTFSNKVTYLTCTICNFTDGKFKVLNGDCWLRSGHKQRPPESFYPCLTPTSIPSSTALCLTSSFVSVIITTTIRGRCLTT